MSLNAGRKGWCGRLLAGILLACLCLAGLAPAVAQSDPASEVIRLVNELRASHGVPPYQVNSVLMQVAQAQANWCAATNHIGHDGPGGSMPNDRAQAAGYGAGYRSYATENQAHGTASFNTPELVVTMWQGDYAHLNAMISADYEHIGVGFAEANGFSWYILMAGWVASDQPAAVTGQTTTAAPAVVPAAPVAVNEPGEDGAIYHQVQSGQAAWTIAARYGLTLEELYELNDLTEVSVIHPGDQLLIRPANTPMPTETAPPTATSPALENTSTPTPPPTTTAPPEIAALSSPTSATSPAATADAVQAPGAGSAMLPVKLMIGAGLVFLLILYFAAHGRRR